MNIIRFIMVLLAISLFVSCSKKGVDSEQDQNPDINPQPIELPAVSNLSVDSTTNGIFYVSWTIPDTACDSIVASTFYLYYSQDSISITDYLAGTLYDSICGNGATNITKEIGISGLLPGIRYYFIIKTSYNGSSEVTYSDIVAAGPYDDFIVTIPDATLDSYIRMKISKETGDLYFSDVLALTEISIINEEVGDLTGLSYLLNLKRIWLYRGSFTDIQELSKLSRLIWIDLTDRYMIAQVSDISPLENLHKLVSLRLGGNPIANLSPLRKLTQLKHLDIYEIEATDLSPLSDLTNLEYLSCGNAQTNDFSPIYGLSKINDLSLWSSALDNLSFLSNFPELRKLYLSGPFPFGEMPISSSDLTFIAAHTDIYELELIRCPIQNIEGLNLLVNLKSLTILECGISNIDVIENYSKLEYVSIGRNSILDITPLNYCPKLCTIYADDNNITDACTLLDHPMMGNGFKLRLDDNPLSEQSTTTCIPQMISAGADVTY